MVVILKGIYYQVGDIVSMLDAEDNVYYAQVHGLLTDAYCEKSACITWLLPSTHSPPPHEAFDPATYVIGLFLNFYCSKFKIFFQDSWRLNLGSSAVWNS